MTYKTPVATIFGGTGFLGRHIVEKVAGEGIVLRIPSRSPSRAAVLRMAGVVGQV